MNVLLAMHAIDRYRIFFRHPCRTVVSSGGNYKQDHKVPVQSTPRTPTSVAVYVPMFFFYGWKIQIDSSITNFLQIYCKNLAGRIKKILCMLNNLVRISIPKGGQKVNGSFPI